MERHIQRLENDIENFPKTDDQQDKFVEKMSISFSDCVKHTFHARRDIPWPTVLLTVVTKASVLCLAAVSSLSLWV